MAATFRLSPIIQSLRRPAIAQRSILAQARPLARAFHAPAPIRFHALPKVGLGLGLAGLATTGLLWRQPVQCDSLAEDIPQDIPQSDLNIQNLGFGTAAGICSGVFVAKGLKAVAFLLGGLFVILQYMSSQSLLKTNWRSIENKYDALVDKAAGGPSAIGSASNRASRLFSRFSDFLMADFPPRATFMAGFLLGLRLG